MPRDPAPKHRDLLDAIDYADSLSSVPQDFTLEDFELEYLGKLNVDDFYEYDDLSGWLEVGKGEFIGPYGDEELNSYRGSEWAGRALQWMEEGIPPVIVISTPEVTAVGDGRGRINLANGLDVPVDAYKLTYTGNLTEAIAMFRNPNKPEKILRKIKSKISIGREQNPEYISSDERALELINEALKHLGEAYDLLEYDFDEDDPCMMALAMSMENADNAKSYFGDDDE